MAKSFTIYDYPIFQWEGTNEDWAKCEYAKDGYQLFDYDQFETEKEMLLRAENHENRILGRGGPYDIKHMIAVYDRMRLYMSTWYKPI